VVDSAVDRDMLDGLFAGIVDMGVPVVLLPLSDRPSDDWLHLPLGKLGGPRPRRVFG
jgi:hypothetical protein